MGLFIGLEVPGSSIPRLEPCRLRNPLRHWTVDFSSVDDSLSSPVLPCRASNSPVLVNTRGRVPTGFEQTRGWERVETARVQVELPNSAISSTLKGPASRRELLLIAVLSLVGLLVGIVGLALARETQIAPILVVVAAGGELLALVSGVFLASAHFNRRSVVAAANSTVMDLETVAPLSHLRLPQDSPEFIELTELLAQARLYRQAMLESNDAAVAERLQEQLSRVMAPSGA